MDAGSPPGMEVTVQPAPEEGQSRVKEEDFVREEVSVLVLGREQSGKTSLVLSLEALRSGSYPKRQEHKTGDSNLTQPLPVTGRQHTIAPRASGGLPVVFLDTAACGARDSVRLPGGRRLPTALRSANLRHDAVLFVLDALDRPLWEDPQRAEELAQLSSTLKQQNYTVVIAVTKLLKARENAQKEVAHGADYRGQVGREPRSSYEVFVSRYLEKTAVALQATTSLKTYQMTQGDGAPLFPLPGANIFDVPTWVSIRDFDVWQERRGTAELPNMRYIQAQLEKLIAALCVIPVVKPGAPWHQLCDDGTAAGDA